MLKLRNRQRLRRKEVAELSADLESAFGCTVFSPDANVDSADAGTFRVLLVEGKSVALLHEGRPLLTVRGVLAYGPTKRYVTVDMGAVKYVYNGADVMAPGIVAADRTIAPGDFLWVRDERNLRPLAVGVAVTSGVEMEASEKGKAVKSIHHVGDELWKMDEV